MLNLKPNSQPVFLFTGIKNRNDGFYVAEIMKEMPQRGVCDQTTGSTYKEGQIRNCVFGRGISWKDKRQECRKTHPNYQDKYRADYHIYPGQRSGAVHQGIRMKW